MSKKKLHTKGLFLFVVFASVFSFSVTAENLEQSQNLFQVSILADGTTKRICTAQASVGDVLSSINFTLGEFDEVSPSIETFIYDNTTIEISRIQHYQEYKISDIEYDYQTVKSYDLYSDQKVVLRQGVAGKRVTYFDVYLADSGKEMSVPRSEILLSEPTNQIELVGILSKFTSPVSAKEVVYYKSLDMISTAYTAEGQINPLTKTETVPKVGTVAVDPETIPLGSKLFITSADGSWEYGYAIAEDTGGKIKGNRIDLFFDTTEQCISYGVSDVKVYILK